MSIYREFPGSEDERVQQVADYLSLSTWHVRVGLAYYAEFADEIDAWIDRNQREAEEAYAEWLRTSDRASA